MTYCLAIALDEGLVFASDSRTNAGADQVSTYSKMYSFGIPGERQFVILSAGNLATTQGVMASLNRDIKHTAETNLYSVADLSDAAEYVGQVLVGELKKHQEAISQAGFSAEASFLMGGQIGNEPAQIYLIYPQGNFITASRQTPFLQIGETKYGKPILDRIIRPETALHDAVRCALLSMDSTIRSNATVGPPIELQIYRPGALQMGCHINLTADSPYLNELRQSWDNALSNAFHNLPDLNADLLSCAD